MWQSVKISLPPIKDKSFDWEEETSGPLLGITNWGKMIVVVYNRFDKEEPFGWKSDCSEGWDLNDVITHWQTLPEAPK